MIDVLLSLGRITLAAVFVVAAATKLLDREGTREAVREFGAPARLAAPLALVLPLAELVVAALLIPTATAVAGALGALALLALFSGAIAVSLARGRAPDCHCFGQLHSAPAGRGTLVRNGALGAVAAFVLAASLAEPATGTFEWTTGLSGAEAVAVGLGVALLMFVAAGLAAFFTLLRSYGTVLVRVERLEEALGEAGYKLEEAPPEGLEPGTPAPAFELAAGEGERVTLDQLLAARLPLLAVFASPGCGPCEALLPEVASWQWAHAERLTVAVLADGESGEIRALAEEHGVHSVLADERGHVAAAYEASATPSAVLIGADGKVSSFLAGGPAAIAELVAEVLDAPGLPVGAKAPAIDGLKALGASTPSLVGRESLVLFWNPDCGFCRSMHEDVLALEAEAKSSSPQLVLISSGSEEATRAEGFASAVLLDPDWSAGEAFGAGGTPSAVLVDADGRIGSEPIFGAETILERARGPRLVQVPGYLRL